MAVSESTLSASQLQTLQLIKRNRKFGFLPSLAEIDFVLDLIDQLTTPDQQNLPCVACEERHL